MTIDPDVKLGSVSNYVRVEKVKSEPLDSVFANIEHNASNT